MDEEKDSELGSQRGECCLLCLCGLPASGKSTLSKMIQSHFQKIKPDSRVLIVSFDQIWLQWQDTTKVMSEGTSTWIDAWGKCRNECIDQVRSAVKDDRNSIVIVDDNMHFASMRHEMYKISRDTRIGFGIIYVKCDVCLCIQRNRERLAHLKAESSSSLSSLSSTTAVIRMDDSSVIKHDSGSMIPIDPSVTDQIIMDMSRKFDDPTSSSVIDHLSKCERNVFVVDSGCSSAMTIGDDLMDFIHLSNTNIPVSLPKNNNEERQKLKEAEQSRVITASSLKHSLDIALRKRIKQVMSAESIRSKSKSEKKILAQKMQSVKKSCQLLSVEQLSHDRITSSLTSISELVSEAVRRFDAKIAELV